LIKHKAAFTNAKSLEEFPFAEQLLACRNKGIFPDLAIKINPQSAQDGYTGGELIELKDSQEYVVSSFNSTIPTAQKAIQTLIPRRSGKMYQQMVAAGDDVFALAMRDVFYLIRGHRKIEDSPKKNVKVCLVYGGFFETVKAENLIQQAFNQVLDERLRDQDVSISAEVQAVLADLFSDQASFSKVRDVEKASVKLRFRIMTESKAEGNLLNEEKYPSIKSNTLNLLVPAHEPDNRFEQAKHYLKPLVEPTDWEQMNVFTIRHLLNGDFGVFQIPL
jgi:hypothetical protein